MLGFLLREPPLARVELGLAGGQRALAGVEVGSLDRGGRGLRLHLHRLRGLRRQLVDLRLRDRRGSRSRGLGDLDGGRFFNLSGVALLAPVASEGEQRGPAEERRQEGMWIDLSHRWILAFQVSAGERGASGMP
jgi:hypothetical protein